MQRKMSPHATRAEVLSTVRGHGLSLSFSDIKGSTKAGLTIDGMDWEEWLEAMTQG